MMWSIVKETRNDEKKDYDYTKYDLEKAAKDIAKGTKEDK